MQTALDPESHIKKRICDACHSETIKDSVITQFRIELERLNIELSNLEKKYETEKFTSEKESNKIEELKTILEETKEDTLSREQELQIELKLLEQDIEKINIDYEEISCRVDMLVSQNNDFDLKIEDLGQHINDLSIDTDEVFFKEIQALKNEIKEIKQKFPEGNFCNQNMLSKYPECKISSLKDDILFLKNEKVKISHKITEMKQVESIKESNISLLLTTLSNKSTNPDMNFSSSYFEDEETIRVQEEEILKLENKIAKRQRKYSLENKTCNCEIY